MNFQRGKKCELSTRSNLVYFNGHKLVTTRRFRCYSIRSWIVNENLRPILETLRFPIIRDP